MGNEFFRAFQRLLNSADAEKAGPWGDKEERLHPRKKTGQFAPKGGGEAGDAKPEPKKKREPKAPVHTEDMRAAFHVRPLVNLRKHPELRKKWLDHQMKLKSCQKQMEDDPEGIDANEQDKLFHEVRNLKRKNRAIESEGARLEMEKVRQARPGAQAPQPIPVRNQPIVPPRPVPPPRAAVNQPAPDPVANPGGHIAGMLDGFVSRGRHVPEAAGRGFAEVTVKQYYPMKDIMGNFRGHNIEVDCHASHIGGRQDSLYAVVDSINAKLPEGWYARVSMFGEHAQIKVRRGDKPLQPWHRAGGLPPSLQHEAPPAPPAPKRRPKAEPGVYKTPKWKVAQRISTATRIPTAKDDRLLSPSDALRRIGEGKTASMKLNNDQGHNVSMVIECDNGQKMLFKPEAGEDRRWCDGLYKDKAPLWKREVAAHTLDMALGFNLTMSTAPTVQKYKGINYLGHRIEGEGDGAGIDFIPDVVSGHHSRYAWVYEDMWSQRFTVFDLIIGAGDRHGNNFMVTERDKGRPVAIDHGYAFPDDHRLHEQFVQQISYPWCRGKAIDKSILEQMDKIKAEDVFKLLVKGGLTDSCAQGAADRFEWLRTHGKYPLSVRQWSHDLMDGNLQEDAE